MEIVILLFVLVGGSIILSAWKRNTSSDNSSPQSEHDENSSCVRKCLACGQELEMKTWISNYNAPKLIIFIGLLLGYIPGLIFLAFNWGKYKCPSCGEIGKNQVIEP